MNMAFMYPSAHYVESVLSLFENESAANKKRGSFTVDFAKSRSDFDAVFRLRYEVFCKEMGATPAPYSPPGMDIDSYDAFADFLVVRHEKNIVGTYRLLPAKRLRYAGKSLYSQQEFQMHKLVLQTSDTLLELGRTCVDKRYRNSIVVKLLWGGLYKVIQEFGYEYVVGCVSLQNLTELEVAAVTQYLRQHHWHEFWDFPVCPEFANPNPLQTDSSRFILPEEDILAKLPPLLKAYLRAGAKVCGGPAYDIKFNTIDYLMLLEVSKIPPAYKNL